MNARTTRRLRLVAVTGSAALSLAPVAAAGVVDGRSPDTRDAAALASFDGRSPDTRDAAVAAGTGTPLAPVDLRSPDTKDAAQLAQATGSTIVVSESSGAFDWTDAGIGAAGGFALALIAGGGLLLVRPGTKGKLAL